MLLCRIVGGELRRPRMRAGVGPRVLWAAVLVSLLSLPTHAKEKGEGSRSSSSKSESSSSKSESSSSRSESSSSKSEKSSEKESSSSKSEQSSEKEDSEHEEESRGEDKSGNLSKERESKDQGGNNRGREGRDEDGPPKTVTEMLRRMTAPSGRGTSDRAGHSPEIPRANNEILAVNLSPAGVAHARKLGFQVRGSVRMSHLGGNVTTLVPPRGMAPGRARQLMDAGQRPDETFAVNQRYSLYQLAQKDMSGENTPSEPALRIQRGTCETDKCFGQKIVGWHDQVQSCLHGIRIGVIDTAVDAHHPSFANARIYLGEFLFHGERAAPAWHGTGVLGLLAGDANSGTPGLIPQGEFYAANVFFRDENGEVVTDTFNVLSALEWMDALDVKIINMSFSGPRDVLVEKAIERMSQQGVVFAAAVGNDGPSSEPSYPAAYSPVIAVTAVNQEMRNYLYANRGEKVDIAAPGVNIWSAVPDAREGYHTGTSFAVPFVTASLAVIYNSVGHREKHEFLARLSAVDLGPVGQDPVYGRGLLVAPTSCKGRDDTITQKNEEVRQDGVAQVPTVMHPSSGRQE